MVTLPALNDDSADNENDADDTNDATCNANNVGLHV